MPLDGSSFNAVNTPQTSIPRQLESFTLYAPPSTDLYRQIPHTDTVTAPILFFTPSYPFTAAEVTVTAKWELEWDQAGLVIFAGDVQTSSDDVPNPSSSPCSTDLASGAQDPDDDQAPPAYSAPERPCKWVKASLEFTNNALHATSVSATSDGADLTIAPLPPPHYNTHQIQNYPSALSGLSSPWSRDHLEANHSHFDQFQSYSLSQHHSHMHASPLAAPPDRTDLRLKLERIGYALWVWYEDPSPAAYSSEPRWKKLREISGFFWGVEDKQIKIGVTASRPANFGMSAWEREHGGALARASSNEMSDDMDGLGDGDRTVTARRGLLVHFEDLEVW